MISATAFRSPAQITPRAIPRVSTVARRGSAVAPAPLPKKLNTRISRSWPMACRIRGAPRKLPRAELRVAAKTPSTTSGPNTLMACSAANGAAFSASRSPLPAVSTIWAT